MRYVSWLPIPTSFLACALAIAVSGCVEIKQAKDGSHGEEDPCANASTANPPILSTKMISGRPGQTVPVTYSGPKGRMKMAFLDQNATVRLGTLVGDDQVTLPERAGLYTVALVDRCTRQTSYAKATVNDTTAGYTPLASIALNIGYWRAWPESSLAVGDFNEDGNDDVVMASGMNGINATPANPGLYVYLYDPVLSRLAAGSIVAQTVQALGIRAGDFDGDGHLDLAWTQYAGGTFRIAKGLGDGTFAAPVEFALPTTGVAGVAYPYYIELTDLDRDGKIDLYIGGGILTGGTAWSAAIWVMKGDGLGGFSGFGTANTTLAYPIQFLDQGDADDDGKMDLYAIMGTAYSSNVKLYRLLQQGDGSFDLNGGATAVVNDALPAPHTMADSFTVGYLNGDNYPDIVVIHPDGPSSLFLSNAADGTLVRSTIPTFADQHGGRAELADLDGDGDVEIYMPLKNRALFANKAGILRKKVSNATVAMSPNAGNTIVGGQALFGWAQGTMRFGDFNGDGKLDIFMPVGAPKYLETLIAN
jgi:hypothetical protein